MRRAGPDPFLLSTVALVLFAAGCTAPGSPAPFTDEQRHDEIREAVEPAADALPEGLAAVRLEASVAFLTPRQQSMLIHLFAAAAEMDRIFWEQSYGKVRDLLDALDDPAQRRRAAFNYGPWDRFRGNVPIVDGLGPKPPGARFYPADMSREEFLSVDMPAMRQARTIVSRSVNGGLATVPYREAYRPYLEGAARQLAAAADLCDDPAFKRYLTLRARALITDDYRSSDQAWVELRSNVVDLVIGPVDRSEDRLFGLKSAYAAWVLLRDRPWTQRMRRIAARLPDIRRDLPVVTPHQPDDGRPAPLSGVYDAVYLAGAANAGPKAGVIEIAGADDPVQRRRAKRLFLHNVMRAQFQRTTLPVGSEMIVRDQTRHLNFDAFMDNALVRDMARGLTPHKEVTGANSDRSLVRDRLEEIESGSADALGVFILGWLHDRGELAVTDLDDHLVTFVATIIEGIRRGGPGSRTRIVQFNYLRAFDGLTRDQLTGRYRIHPGRAREAIAALATQLLIIERNGDYEAAQRLAQDMGGIDRTLQQDLKRLSGLDVPAGLVFEQGPDVLGVK